VNARIRSGLPLAVHRCRFDTSDACTRCAVRGCPQADDMPLFSVSWRRPSSPAAPPRPQDGIRALACR
jgi:hypothetical protein